MDAWPVILVLGSLLGLIAAALVRKAAGKGDLAAPAMRKCPHCATLLRDDVPLCRSSLNVVPLASASESRSRVSSRPARATGGQRRARERLRPGAIVAPTGRRESGQPGARRRGASEIPSVSDPPAKTRPPQWPGIAAFVALTFVCAWASTLLVDRAWDGLRGVFPTRLLAVSAHYWLTMGWPPLLAILVVRRWIEPPGPLDFGLAPSGRGILVLGGLAAVSVPALATMITRWGEARRLTPAAAAPIVDSPVPSGPSVETIAMLGIAFVMTVVLLWGQAFIEELGWRGYLLPRMMQSLGPWPGLLVHGLVWGMWYVPVVALAAGAPSSTPVRGVAFVVTGTLLGTLLGWLRLAQSLSLAVVFNVVLTVAAGLPFILRGVDVGSRGAAYGPVGWIPLLMLVGILFIAPTRRAVRTPPGVATHPRGPTTVRRLVGVGASRNGNHAR